MSHFFTSCIVSLGLLSVGSTAAHAQITPSQRTAPQSTAPQNSQQDSSRKTYRSDEVIVTGFPAVEGKTPAPFERYGRDALEQQNGATDLPQLIATMPSALVYSQNGSGVGYSFVNVRGFDQRRLSILVNGIPQNDPEDHNVYWIDMPDLSSNAAQVSVQRGAGSAFYGPPAIGGSLNVETFASANRDIAFSAGYGSYNTRKYAATLNSGLISDKYILTAHLSQTHTDGYRDDSWVDLNSYYISAVRFDSNLTIQANFYGGPISDGLNYYGVFPTETDRTALTDPVLRRQNWSEPGAGTYERRPQEREDFTQPHYEILSTWTPSKSVAVSNSLFYIHGAGQFDYDGTWPYLFTGVLHSDYYRLTAPYAARYGFTPLSAQDTSLGNELVRGFVGGDQYGWLPRVEIDHDNGKLTVGAEVRSYRSNHWGQLLSAAVMPADLPGDYHFYDYRGGKDILSGYLSEQLSLTKEITVLASLQAISNRYKLYDEKPLYVDTSMANARGIDTGWTSYSFSIPLFFVNPRLGVNLRLSSGFGMFASVAYTSREPRLSDYYNAEFLSEPNFALDGHGGYDFSKPNIRPEHLLDLELGGRGTVSERSGFATTFSFNGYLMNFTDEIIATGASDHFGGAISGNADKTTHYGLELAASQDIGSRLSVSLNATLSHNEILKFSEYAGSDNVIGHVPIGFPSLTGALVLNAEPIDHLKLSLTARYVGTMYGDLQNSDLFKNDPYLVADGVISYRVPDALGLSYIEFKLQGYNLLNATYASYVTSGTGFFVGAPINVFGQLQVGL